MYEIDLDIKEFIYCNKLDMNIIEEECIEIKCNFECECII
jgi:hypothetical protein